MGDRALGTRPDAEPRAEDPRRRVRRALWGAFHAAWGMPALFFLRFGRLDAYAAGVTVAMAALCLLMAVGFHFADRRDVHATRAATGGFLDRIGSLWLLACFFCPLLNWLLRELTASSLSGASWRRIFWIRVFITALPPLLCAASLVRYVEGRAARIQIPLLLLVTALPLSTTYWMLRDLRAGARPVQVVTDGRGTCGSPQLGDLSAELCAEFPDAGRFDALFLAHSRRLFPLTR